MKKYKKSSCSYYSWKSENGAFLRINDFTISFESHCYFTTSVKRGFEIIYLLSVRWWHCVRARHTLVWGILMCAYSHILFRPKIRPNTPNTNLKCQENVCFCICVCAGTDMWKMNENKTKPRKTSTRFEKGQKPEPGKQKDKRKLTMFRKVLRDSSKYKDSPWIKFWRLATSVPVLSTIVKKWSLEEIFKFNPS